MLAASPEGPELGLAAKGKPGKAGIAGLRLCYEMPVPTSHLFALSLPIARRRHGGTGLPHPGKLGLGCGMGQNWEKNEGKSRGIRPSLLCKAVEQPLSPLLQPPLTQG